MGVYLVSVNAAEWFGADEDDEDSYSELAVALNEELVRRGLGPYESVPDEAPFVRGSGLAFEEKLIPPMNSFMALCKQHLSTEETEALCGWSALVPVSLEEPVHLPVSSGYTDESVVAGAWQVLTVAEKLAAAIELPDEVPEICDNLDLTMWFQDGPAQELAGMRPGPWSADLDASFYAALFLRAAQHSLRRGCPIVLT